MPLLGLNWGLQATILHRYFKIQGTIGEVWQKDKLGYQSLMLQVEIGLGKGYTDKEIVTAVIQGLKFAVSRYPRDTEIWFWILNLFYLYPDGIPHFFKNRDSS
jgi:hypothetical protein